MPDFGGIQGSTNYPVDRFRSSAAWGHPCEDCGKWLLPHEWHTRPISGENRLAYICPEHCDLDWCKGDTT